MSFAAVYPGTFDPVTKGHLDIALRARDIFGSVVVLLIPNGNKKTLFTQAERFALLQEAFRGEPGIRVEQADGGLLSDYLKKNHLRLVVRGLRGASDVEYEFINAHYNKLFNPEIETVFLPGKPENAFLSSSAVREAFLYGADIISLVPPCVAEAINKKRKNA